MRTYLFLLSTLLFLDFQALLGQCEVVATALPNNITCGTCVTLTAFGEGQGTSVFTENFNSGAPTGWLSTAQATYTNPCDANGVDGTPHLWMGSATGVPRQMTTTSFNFSTATAGATICFDMLFAEQGDPSPCEGPDEPDEGVYLQYSINNGATWITIHYFNPNGGNDASLINWNNWCFALPAAALTGNTRIRWFQDNDSGANYDHWGLDNVNIYFNDPTYSIIWQHDGYTYGIGNGGGNNPTPVCPQVTTTYTVTMTNGTSTCTDNVTINVVDPVFRVSASPDTTLCPGECANLLGEATVIVSPAKTPTYANSEVAALTGLPSAQDLANILLPCVNFSGCNCPNGSTVPFLGTCPAIFTGTLSMNINITDLNTTSLQSGQLTRVCIGNALMLAGNLSPFAVTLTCPSGNTITLANAGNMSGTSLTNTCFNLTSTTPISAGSSPYSGNFQPVNPLTNLNGCSGNGVWTLSFTGTFNLSSGTLPLGVLNGWNITFNDPEIAYTGNFTWSPTTNMTASNTLTPAVCPTVTQSYTLLVTDTAGCSSDSAEVLVTVSPTACCPIDISYTSIAPSCGLSDGSIDISVANGSGNYSYSWTGGLPSTQDVTGLGIGTYTVSVTDNVQMCSKNLTITLTPLNAPTISSVVNGSPSCLNNDGTITITASGGLGTLLYSIDNGLSFQASSIFDSLAAGTYSIVVEDTSSCSVTQQTVLVNSAGAQIDSVSAQNESCGGGNGQITITSSGGFGTYSYSIDGGLSFQSAANFTSLSAGTYNVVVEDQNGCGASQTVNVANSSGPVLSSVATTQTSCASDNGVITVVASGGTPLEYSIDNGLTFQTSNLFDSLSAGSYTLVVRVQGNVLCNVDSIVTINTSTGISIDNVDVLDESCFGANDGSIELLFSGGTAPYTITYNGQAGTTLMENLASGPYAIQVSDVQGCSSATVTPNVGAGILVAIETINDTTVNIGQEVTLTTNLNGVLGGSYSWTPVTDLSCTDCSSPTVLVVQDVSYQVIYTDASNTCSDTASVNLFAIAEDPFCLFPNAFSPNADNYNDVFRAICDDIHQIELKIYNRWGERIFTSKGGTMNTLWDGSIEGKQAPLDVYIYVANIEYINNTVQTLTGNFTLIR